MDSDALPSCLTYIENCYESFNLISFYKNFMFGQKDAAESIFKKCIGRFKRVENDDLRAWANTIAANNFEILNRTDASQYWRKLNVKEARKEAVANAEESIYKKLIIKFQSPPNGKRKRKESDMQKKYTLTIVPPTADNRWLINKCDVSQLFFELQEEAAQYIEETKEVPLEESVYELMSLQNILLIKPHQYNDRMLDIFGETLLTKVYQQQLGLWVDDCPSFDDEEATSIQEIVSSYMQKHTPLKVATHKLCSLVIEMDHIKTSAINAIRRLMEKLPVVQPLEGCKSENELCNTYVDPLLDSLLSDPENGVHLRWTNLNDTDEGLERPDSVISIMQSNWGNNLGYGEVKIEEPTTNKFMLAWNLCRLGHFSKDTINTTSNKSSISFQVKGHYITVYITTLNADGIYTMVELIHLQIPQSVENLDRLTTKSSLEKLLWVAHMFEKIRQQKKEESSEFVQMKRYGPGLAQFRELISDKRDRKRPCTLRF
ncbi:hypothetical protein CLU79DRAFT_824718 [Phycomyces nitens]|nr:hypothetical protein CLU79DRAFT_824718 [Phycomyces nitens]